MTRGEKQIESELLAESTLNTNNNSVMQGAPAGKTYDNNTDTTMPTVP